MGIINRIRALFGGRKDFPLFDNIKNMFTNSELSQIRQFFSGLGDTEVLAIYDGEYCMNTIRQVSEYLSQGRMQRLKSLQVGNKENDDGPLIFYIRGSFAKEEAEYVLSKLHQCIRTGDKVLVQDRNLAKKE